LLGAATGIFSKTELVGLRDSFDFDFKSRGNNPEGWLANIGVALIRADAWACGNGNVSIAVSGGIQ